jgi:hypothetical protein
LENSCWSPKAGDNISLYIYSFIKKVREKLEAIFDEEIKIVNVRNEAIIRV